MTFWYQRQFGDRTAIALCFAFGPYPTVSNRSARDVSWGNFELWVHGKCLTASNQNNESAQGIDWYLLPILEWFLDVGVRLINEEPLPTTAFQGGVRDACSWFDATMRPPLLSEHDEETWFLSRSEWRQHHALRRAAEDLALPNVVFRRLGDDLEVSWDNETLSASRPNLHFQQLRGRELVLARDFAEVVTTALRETSLALAARSRMESLVEFHERCQALLATGDDWRWLVPNSTATTMLDHTPELVEQIRASATRSIQGLYVPHTPETNALRFLQTQSAEDIRSLLDATQHVGGHPIRKKLQSLCHPRPAQAERPWDEGNEFAEVVRHSLGWEQNSTPDLRRWLTSQRVGIVAGDLRLPESIAVLSYRTEDSRTLIHVNPRSKSRVRSEIGLATALGHLLLDVNPIAVDGELEHWPTAARARAFGIALMLPEDGVRESLRQHGAVDPYSVSALMKAFRTSPIATTQRLLNLGLISEDQRLDLLGALHPA